MTDNRKIRCIVIFISLSILVAAGFAAQICIGSVNIKLFDVFKAITMQKSEDSFSSIIMDIRLPRAIMTLVLGGGLAVSGFLLQTYFSNPIAGPYILGISSGAKMVVAVVLILFSVKSGRISSLVLVLAAFAGAVITTLFIILIARYVRNIAILLAAGVMVGYICSAVTDFLIAFADDSDIVNLHGWSQGSFSGSDMTGCLYALFIVGISFFLVMMLCKPLDALRLGEEYARSVGISVKKCRIMIIVLSSILSACVTAFAGPVSFIGIAVPFLMRELLKSSKPVVLVPACFLSGAVFCMFSDLLARCIFSPTELNISAVTSLFGAPIVIYMIVRRSFHDRAF